MHQNPLQFTTIGVSNPFALFKGNVHQGHGDQFNDCSHYGDLYGGDIKDSVVGGRRNVNNLTCRGSPSQVTGMSITRQPKRIRSLSFFLSGEDGVHESEISRLDESKQEVQTQDGEKKANEWTRAGGTDREERCPDESLAGSLSNNIEP